MHPASPARIVSRRLCALLLALLAMCGLVNTNATPARADTGNSAWTVYSWDVTELEGATSTVEGAGNYRNLIASLRYWVGHRIEGADARLQETERVANHFIEVQVLTGNPSQHHLSLYFRTNDLYLVGFAANSQRWQFGSGGRDQTALARAYRDHYHEAGGFNDLGYDENYNTLDPDGERGDMTYRPWALHNQLMSFRGITRQNANSYRVRLAYLAQTTAEAARFQWIENRIYGTLRSGVSDEDDSGYRYDFVGSFGMALENRWADLSRLIYRFRRGATVAPVVVDRREYRTPDAIIRGDIGLPRIGTFLAASSQRNA
ncbi:Ribosome inactivating protein (plasmid) [Streptomyces rimosus subsp. rimosus]|uniref:Ribosome inactivating protein n=1 Tax=Streptomyces rimosus subsp. rimosus TaxID=132474 RepID=A0ABY3YSK7_STRRM|nr:hypothetical protein ADK42_22145 [Streptomyces rimosus subsp. rimosus]QDA02452.1 hypothetical protein CTZ40_00140 [Streptomyces rimosus]QGY69130.1 hypothetical protein V519_027475 [Streptomyces rimosus R6-500]QEV73716.1 hypothetical protein CP984_00145 [Streptomyces rimosus]QTL84674.1 hypothetical protein FMM49_01605 [Streptomyces rimosus subsp. rimosus]